MESCSQCYASLVQAQRVGPAPADASTLFPNIWSAAGGWKTPAFTDMCSSVVSTLDPTDAASSDLSSFGGYFEAGSTLSPFPAFHSSLAVLNCSDKYLLDLRRYVTTYCSMEKEIRSLVQRQ